MTGIPSLRLSDKPEEVLAGGLRELLEQQGIYASRGTTRGKTVILFPGHGAQYLNMLKELTEYQAVAETFQRADMVYQGLTGQRLTAFIFPQVGSDEVESKEVLQRPEVMQPAIYAAEMALFALVREVGLQGDIFLGHSLGEYAALTAAGVLTFEDGLKAVYERGCAVAQIPPAARGTMISLHVGENSEAISGVLSKARGYHVRSLVNSPDQWIISGEEEAIAQIEDLCRKEGITATKLSVSHGFHSQLLAPAVDPLTDRLRGIKWKQPEAQVLSSIHGNYYEQADLENLSAFLASQLITPLNFAALVQKAYGDGGRVFIEVGPRSILSNLVKKILVGKKDVLVSPTNVPALGDGVSWARFLAFVQVHDLFEKRRKEEVNP